MYENLAYGPDLTKSNLIVENSDEEGGGYDVYSGAREEVLVVAQARRSEEQTDRVSRVAAWKRYGWQGLSYSKLYPYVIVVFHADGTKEDFSLPEELTGI